MVKISVIIPLYNSSEALYICLDSVISQTLKDIEIICVDDGSTDNSLEILQKYAKMDDRIKVIHQNNINAGAARNNGMQYAQGEYLIFLDSDDVYYSTMLEKLYNKAEETQSDLVITKYDLKNIKTNVLQRNQGFKQVTKELFNRRDIKNIFDFSTFVPWNKLYKKSFVDKCNLKFTETKISNDISFVIKTLFLAERISKIEESLLLHNYYNSSSLTSRRGDYIDELPQSCDEIYQFLLDNNLYSTYKSEFINFLFNNCIYNLSFQSNRLTLARLKQNFRNSKCFTLFKDLLWKECNIYAKKYKKYLYTNIFTLFLIPSLKKKFHFYKNLKINIQSLDFSNF